MAKSLEDKIFLFYIWKGELGSSHYPHTVLQTFIPFERMIIVALLQ